MTCSTCGRTDADGGGHWMGCEVAMSPAPAPEPEPTARTCALADCGNEVTGDKRIKYCDDHKDPKNRKE